eukprot:Clim_evm22s196 gene=Clim_evmTU22s196
MVPAQPMAHEAMSLFDNGQNKYIYAKTSSREGNATWLKEIEPDLRSLFEDNKTGMSRATYMNVYTIIYSLCTNNASQKQPQDSNQGAIFGGEEVYRSLSEFLKEHLQGIEKQAASLQDEGLLRYFNTEWNRYLSAAKCANHLFNYLNRHWIKRKKDELEPVYFINTLCLVLWREEVFRPLADRISRALRMLIKNERDGETIDTSLVSQAVQCLVMIGANDDGGSASRNDERPLSIYRVIFEQELLEETRKYYEAERDDFIDSNPVTEYMKKVEARLEEEQRRVQILLHPSTEEKLLKACKDVLISERIEKFYDEFKVLLENDMNTDLARMYSLLFRVPNGLNKCQESFQEHIIRQGNLAINANLENASTDEKKYINILLTTHRKYSELVQSAFNGDSSFVASLDKACRDFFNRNEVTKKDATGYNTHKSPEMLAKYCDGLLRKSSKTNEEGDLEDALNDLMVIFQYMVDKDVFNKFYSKHLSARLINKMSASDDAEESMISKLKVACGYEYVKKLQRMFQDVGTSRDLNTEFNGHLQRLEVKLDSAFEVQVLAAGSWPIGKQHTEFIPPPDLRRALERFEAFYNKKHSGRKLEWQYHRSKADIVARFNGMKYTITGWSYQTAILLMFNERDEITFDEIHQATKIQKPYLEKVIEMLFRTKLLKGPEKLQDDSKIILNKDFKSKRIRINIAMALRHESKAESEETHRTIDQDRMHTVQAAIVRVMKTRKTMKHQQLIQEVIAQVSHHFKPNISVIKKQIDALLEKEYICRDEDSPGVYNYVA